MYRVQETFLKEGVAVGGNTTTAVAAPVAHLPPNGHVQDAEAQVTVHSAKDKDGIGKTLAPIQEVQIRRR